MVGTNTNLTLLKQAPVTHSQPSKWPME